MGESPSFGVVATTDDSVRIRATRRIADPWALAITASLALMLMACLHAYRPGFVIAQGDSTIVFEPIDSLRKSFAIWNHFESPVGSFGASVAWAPFYLLYGGLSIIFGTSLAELLVVWLLLCGAWLGALAFARTLGVSAPAALVVAWAYSLNAWTQLFVGNNFAACWVIAIVPWAAAGFVMAARFPEHRRWVLAIFGIGAFVVLPVVGANPALVALFALCVALAVGIALFYAVDLASFARWGVTAAGIIVGASLWWIVPVLRYYAVAAAPVTTLSPHAWAWVVDRSSILNNLRFNGYWGWAHLEYYPFAHAYDANPITYASGFLFFICALIGLLVLRGRELVLTRFALVVGLVAVFLSKGLHPPLAAVNEAVYQIPLMFLFREPTTKLPLIALIALCVPLAFVAQRVIDALGSTPVARRMAGGWVVGVVLGFTGAPAVVTGAIYHDATLGLPSQYARVPTYWRDVAARLNASTERGAVIVLPSNKFYQVDYGWGLYGADFLPNALIRRPVLLSTPLSYTADAAIQSARERLFDAVENGSPLAPAMLRDFGIRYVLYRGDCCRADHSAKMRMLLHGYPSTSFGPLSLFDLGVLSSPLEVSGTFIVTEGRPRTAGDFIETRALEERVPRLTDPAFALTGGLIPAAAEHVGCGGVSRFHGTAPVRVLLAAMDVPAACGVAGSPRVSMLRRPTPYLVQEKSATVLHPVRLPSGRPLPSVTGISLDPAGSTILDVVYPSDRDAVADIRTAVQPQRDTRYRLIVLSTGRIFEDSVARSASEVWAEFRRVPLHPGANQFVLASEPARRPVRTASGYTGLRVGDVRFSNVTPGAVAALGYPAPLLAVALNTPGNRRPALLVDAPAFTGRLGTTVWLRIGRVSLLCYYELGGERWDDIAVHAADCLRRNGMHAEGATEAGATYESAFISPMGSPPSWTGTIGSVSRIAVRETFAQHRGPEGSLPDGVSIAAYGAGPLHPAELPLPVVWATDGVAIGDDDVAGSHLVLFGELYDPAWIAVSLHAGPHILPHAEADGWRNAWLSTAPGRVYIFNLAVCLQLALLIGGAAFVFTLGRRFL